MVLHVTRPRDKLGRPLPPGAADERLYGDPVETARSFDDALAKAIELFDTARFFEAHEFFEYLWKSPESDSSDRDFWQGLAQVAVGYCHVQRGNPHGARTLLARGATRLQRYPTPHHGVATAALRDAALTAVQHLRAGAELAQLPLPKLTGSAR